MSEDLPPDKTEPLTVLALAAGGTLLGVLYAGVRLLSTRLRGDLRADELDAALYDYDRLYHRA